MAFESLNFTHGKIALLKRSIKQGKGRTFTIKLGICLVKKVSKKRNIQMLKAVTRRYSRKLRKLRLGLQPY